jgi:type IV secretion system protein VirB9
MLDREAPALFVISSMGDTQLVNYRVKNDTYVVDRLFDSAELRLDQKDGDRPHRPHPLERIS